MFRHVVSCSDLRMFLGRTSTYKSLAPGRSEEFEGTEDGEEANEQAEEEELENDEEVENSDEETGPAGGFNMTGYGRGNAEEQEEGSESFESSENEEDPGDEQMQGEDEGFEEASAFEAGDASPAADIERDVDQAGCEPNTTWQHERTLNLHCCQFGEDEEIQPSRSKAHMPFHRHAFCKLVLLASLCCGERTGVKRTWYCVKS